MSRTTAIIIYAHPTDAPAVTDLSAWLADEAPRSDDRTGDRAGHLLPMDDTIAADAWGGHKAPTQGLWGGVANHLDLPAFTAHVATVAWREPRCLQILLKDEADPWFRSTCSATASSPSTPPPPTPTKPSSPGSRSQPPPTEVPPGLGSISPTVFLAV